jgi:hypothetical protein
LIGAGCSVTAGIATAAGFVDLIKQKFESAFNRASDKTYPSCMAELEPGPQRDLIIEQVSKARINWAHIAIAQLMRNRYVDRVLTTNFDPLVLRACAMLGEFPAVYDFATSQEFRPGELPEKAIFHLHGQSTGFVLMNTEDEVNKHSERLGPLFKDAGQARAWIVVGYSGGNDPVFDHLADVDQFPHGLFWVGFKDEEPRAHIREKLLRRGKHAYLVRGYDADRFFVELAQKLECFPPEFVERPFSFLKDSLSMLTGYRQVLGDKEIDILHDVRGLIGRAISQYEAPAASSDRSVALYAQAPSHEAIELAATSLLMAARYEDLERLQRTLGAEEMTPSLRETFAWSSIEQGNALSDQAEVKSGAKADALLKAAGEKYAAALAIKPDMHEALTNWGTALSDQAKVKSRAEAGALFAAAGEKYAAALAIKPEYHEALSNWGSLYVSWSAAKTADEAEWMLQQAEAKLLKAEEIKEGSGSYNLACVAARRGDAASCREWLERSKENGRLPDSKHLLADPDLASVRDQQWFRTFLEGE